MALARLASVLETSPPAEAAPEAPSTASTTRRSEIDRERWVREDTGRVIEACDRVLGAGALLLLLLAVGSWLRGRTDALTVALVCAFPLVNLLVSRFGRGHRVRGEWVRVTVNAPLLFAIHAYSAGSMRGMWLPLMLFAAGGALTWPALTRRQRWGKLHALAVAGLLVVAAVVADHPWIPTVGRALSIALVGWILAATMASLGTSLLSARTRRAEAETATRELERSLAALDERTRGLRLLLDSMAQGFVTIDLHGVMAHARSAILERWFGPAGDDTTLSALIARHDAGAACWLDLGLETLREDAMPVEVCLDQLPRRLVADRRTLELSYRPLDGDPGHLLVVVSDVTADLERARAERAERELVTLVQQITADRGAFDELLEEAGALVTALATPREPRVERRALHTLKGTCAMYGLVDFADRCRAIEGELSDRPGGLGPLQRTELARAWQAQLAAVQRLVGGAQRPTIALEPDELNAAVERARRGEASRELAATMASWMLEPARRRLERLAAHAAGLARRLNKGELDVEVIDDGVRLDATRWSALWSALVHAVTNAVDHGIEAPEVRAAGGKPARARLELAATRAAGELIVRITDDGRGVDWAEIAVRAAAMGLPSASPAELAHALLADGVTTRDAANETSGRGVGLAALRAATEALGGTIEVESVPLRGTTLRCRFADPDATPRRDRRTTAPPLRALA